MKRGKGNGLGALRLMKNLNCDKLPQIRAQITKKKKKCEWKGRKTISTELVGVVDMHA